MRLVLACSPLRSHVCPASVDVKSARRLYSDDTITNTLIIRTRCGLAINICTWAKGTASPPAMCAFVCACMFLVRSIHGRVILLRADSLESVTCVKAMFGGGHTGRAPVHHRRMMPTQFSSTASTASHENARDIGHGTEFTRACMQRMRCTALN